MGYKLGTTALIYKDIYNAFRISCIMLILDEINNNILISSIFMLPFD